jgi:hypothetical protein
MIEGYRKDIKELKEKLTHTNPLEVTAEREQQESMHIDMIENESKEVAKLFDRNTHLWTTLGEDVRVQ